VVAAIPGTPDDMPEEIEYDAAAKTLRVGHGRISPVRAEVWAYEVSGMKVVKKWFGYRKKNPAGRKSSPLDDIHSEMWRSDFTTELLQLLNVLTQCVDLEPAQIELLSDICAGPLITVRALEDDLVFPVPAHSRKPPAIGTIDTPTLPY
jgi:hypothetical protein